MHRERSRAFRTRRGGLAEGREKGRIEGSEAATEACEEEFAALTDAWRATLDRWESEFNVMLHSARDDVLRFAFAMGRKITLRSIERDPTVVADQVAEALTYLSRPSSIKVVVHPDDRALVERVLPDLAARMDGCDHAAIEVDGGVKRGGCVIRTSRGVIDATIEKQIARIADTLLPEDADEDHASDEPGTGPEPERVDPEAGE